MHRSRSAWLPLLVALLVAECSLSVAAPRAGTAGSAASRIVGAWLFRGEGVEIRATFTSAGRFTRVMKTGEGQESSQGSYTLAGGKLVIKPEGGGDELHFNVRIVDDDQVELTDAEGSGIRMVRQTSAAPEGVGSGDGAAAPSARPPAVRPSPESPAKGANGKTPRTVVFRRFAEPREKAFTALIPKGWKVDGGIIRLAPDVAGARNATGAKGDITLKRDDAGTILMRWLPDLWYLDTRGQPYEGLTRIGQVFNNVLVLPKLGVEGYLVQAVLPRVLPQARNVQVLSRAKLPKLADLYARGLLTLPAEARQSIHYDAGMVTLSFEEGGKQYKARMVAVVQDMGPLGVGLWQAQGTHVYRAPAGEFDAWLPVLGIIQGSVEWNTHWLRAEIRESIKREGLVTATEEYLRRVDQEIVRHRMETNAEIRNQMYLNLTNQEEYVNPFTGKTEVGSNQWSRRWQNANGDLIYSNDAGYNPNADPDLQAHGFKVSAVRRK